MVNKVELIGRVGKQPVYAPVTGNSVSRLCFSVATNSPYKKPGETEWTENTQWHNCVIWGPMADKYNNGINSGVQVYVEGELRYHDYEKEGQNHRVASIKVNRVLMLGSKSDNVKTTKQEPMYGGLMNLDFTKQEQQFNTGTNRVDLGGGDDLPF